MVYLATAKIHRCKDMWNHALCSGGDCARAGICRRNRVRHPL